MLESGRQHTSYGEHVQKHSKGKRHGQVSYHKVKKPERIGQFDHMVLGSEPRLGVRSSGYESLRQTRVDSQPKHCSQGKQSLQESSECEVLPMAMAKQNKEQREADQGQCVNHPGIETIINSDQG